MKNEQNFSENRSLNDRSWDLLAEIWVMQELKRIEGAEESESETQEMDAFFSKYDSHNIKQIEQYMSTLPNRKKKKQQVRKFVQVAAMVLSVFFLSIGIAAASSATVRAQVLKLLIRITPEYTSLQIGQTEEKSVEVPSKWQGLFYPTSIPQGLVLLDSYEEADGNTSIEHAYYISSARYDAKHFAELERVHTKESKIKAKRIKPAKTISSLS